MTARSLAMTAALAGGLAVALGAFAAHGMEPGSAELMATASRYAMWHALAVLAVLALARDAVLAPALFLWGVLLFSGSLAAYALGGPKALVFVTPVGGVLLIAGWLAAALALRRAL